MEQVATQKLLGATHAAPALIVGCVIGVCQSDVAHHSVSPRRAPWACSCLASRGLCRPKECFCNLPASDLHLSVFWDVNLSSLCGLFTPVALERGAAAPFAPPRLSSSTSFLLCAGSPVQVQPPSSRGGPRTCSDSTRQPEAEPPRVLRRRATTTSAKRAAGVATSSSVPNAKQASTMSSTSGAWQKATLQTPRLWTNLVSRS